MTRAETPTETAPGRTFAQTALGIAGTVQDRARGGAMSRGERAELRRMRDHEVFPPEPYWRLVDRYDISASEESFWGDVVPLMVDHPHNGALAAGRALAKAGVSAPRIERWLRLDPERARKEAGRLLARLGEGLNWASFAGLLRFWYDRDRRQFARDYFLSPEHRERKPKLTKQESN